MMYTFSHNNNFDICTKCFLDSVVIFYHLKQCWIENKYTYPQQQISEESIHFIFGGLDNFHIMQTEKNN